VRACVCITGFHLLFDSQACMVRCRRSLCNALSCTDAQNFAIALSCLLQGNSHTKRPQASEEPSNDSYAAASPPFSPGSPLTYVPQMPMEPAMSRSEDSAAHRGASPEFHSDVAGWPAQPRLVPTKILCKCCTSSNYKGIAATTCLCAFTSVIKTMCCALYALQLRVGP